MCQKFTADELNTMDHQAKNDVICQMQDRLDKLEHDYENLMEQVRLANQQRFGRHTENWMGLQDSSLSLMKQKPALTSRIRNLPLTKLLIPH